jgi:hypothetical protein
MMTERMRAVVASVEQLPPEAQDRIAEQIASAIDNAIWDTQLRNPDRLEALRALAEEAMNDPVLPFPTLADMEHHRPQSEGTE